MSTALRPRVPRISVRPEVRLGISNESAAVGRASEISLTSEDPSAKTPRFPLDAGVPIRPTPKSEWLLAGTIWSVSILLVSIVSQSGAVQIKSPGATTAAIAVAKMRAVNAG